MSRRKAAMGDIRRAERLMTQVCAAGMVAGMLVVSVMIMI